MFMKLIILLLLSKILEKDEKILKKKADFDIIAVGEDSCICERSHSETGHTCPLLGTGWEFGKLTSYCLLSQLVFKGLMPSLKWQKYCLT